MKLSKRRLLPVLVFILLFVSISAATVLNVNSHGDWSPGTAEGASPDRDDNSGNVGIGYHDGSSGDSLVGFWRLDRTSYGNVIDYSGSGNDLSENSFDNDERGHQGIFSTNGFEFHESEYLETGSALIPASSDFTFSAWVKVPSGVTSDGSSNDDAIMGQTDGLTFYPVTSYGSASNQVRLWDASLGELLVGSDIRGDGWTHLSIVRDGSDFTLYENGTVADTVSDSGSLSEGSFRIGGGHVSRFFKGDLDEVRVYDRALSDSEVKDLYFNGGDGIHEGNYTRTVETSSNKSWNTIEVDASIPSSTDASMVFKSYKPGDEIVDSFEDGDFSEYTRTESGTFEIVSSPTSDGSNALESQSGQGGTDYVASDSGLDAYPSAGDTFTVDVQPGGLTDDITTSFGVKDASSWSAIRDNRYYVEFEFSDDEMLFYKVDGGSYTQIGSKAINIGYTAGEWHTLEVQWGSGGSFTVTLYDNTDTQIAEITGTDTTFSSGGISFHNPSSMSNNVYFDNYRIKGAGGGGSDTEEIPLRDGVNNYTLDVLDWQNADITFKGTSADETKTWTINDFDLFYEGDGCSPPNSGNWLLSSDCTIYSPVDTPANVEVSSSSTLKIAENGALGVDLQNDYLLVKATSKVLVDALGGFYSGAMNVLFSADTISSDSGVMVSEPRVDSLYSTASGSEETATFDWSSGTKKDVLLDYEQINLEPSDGIDDRYHTILEARNGNGNTMFSVHLPDSNIHVFDAQTTNPDYNERRTYSYDTGIGSSGTHEIKLTHDGSNWNINIDNGAYTRTFSGITGDIYTLKFSGQGTSDSYLQGLHEFDIVGK